MEDKILKFATAVVVVLTVAVCIGLPFFPQIHTWAVESREERLAEQEYAENQTEMKDLEIVAADTSEQVHGGQLQLKLPEGINTIIGENGQGLSEGQAQRISIARAVLRDAPVILLDEATSALDVDTEEKVLKNIIKKDSKKICIVTTHRPVSYTHLTLPTKTLPTKLEV